MVPSVFVRLDEMPLNRNGKVDRKALPPVETGSEVRVLIEPATEQEALIAGIWGQVLETDQVSVEDNFFAVGGTRSGPSPWSVRSGPRACRRR